MIEVQRPNWLGVVLDCPGALNLNKVPDFDLAVSRGSGQMSPQWVEGNVWDPVAMAVSGHDFLSLGKSPDAPGSIIGGSGQKWFVVMNDASWDGLIVSLDSFDLLDLSI